MIPAGFIVKAGSFFTSKKFLIPLAIVSLLLAIGGGTYFFLNKSKNEAVATAVKGENTKATVQSLETLTKVQDATITIDVKMDKLRDQTIRDYSNVQNRIDNAPIDQRQAQTPALIIDTLNELDRLRSARDTDSSGPSG